MFSICHHHLDGLKPMVHLWLPASCVLLQMLKLPCGFKVQKKTWFLREKNKDTFFDHKEHVFKLWIYLGTKKNISNIRGSKIVYPRVERGQLDRWAPSLIVINGGGHEVPYKMAQTKKWVSVRLFQPYVVVELFEKV